MRLLEALFFTGLVGCVLVIAISWIKIFGDGFSDSDSKTGDSNR